MIAVQRLCILVEGDATTSPTACQCMSMSVDTTDSTYCTMVHEIRSRLLARHFNTTVFLRPTNNRGLIRKILPLLRALQATTSKRAGDHFRRPRCSRPHRSPLMSVLRNLPLRAGVRALHTCALILGNMSRQVLGRVRLERRPPPRSPCPRYIRARADFSGPSCGPGLQGRPSRFHLRRGDWWIQVHPGQW